MPCQDTLPSSQLLHLTTPIFNFLNTLSLDNQTFLDLKVLQTKISNNSAIHPQFWILNGIIYCKGKPYLSKNATYTSFVAGVSCNSDGWLWGRSENT